MKALRLLEGAACPPERLAVVFKAFDEAWTEIESSFVGDGPRENGRAHACKHPLVTCAGPCR